MDSFQPLKDSNQSCWPVYAEGSLGTYPAKDFVSLNVIYYNTNLELLRFVHRAICKLGFHPLEPYLDKKKGFRSPDYHIEMKKDYWRVMLARFEESKLLSTMAYKFHPYVLVSFL